MQVSAVFSTELTGDARLINVYNVIFVKLLCDIFSFRVEFSVIVRPKQTNTLNILFFFSFTFTFKICQDQFYVKTIYEFQNL